MVNKSTLRFLFLLALGFLFFVQPATLAQDVLSDEYALGLAIQKSLQQTSNEDAVLEASASLQVASAHIVEIDDLDFTAYMVKILDSRTDTIYTYWYDANVEPTTEEMAFNTRAAAYEVRHGRLSDGILKVV